jgi:hypothetical protein
MSNLKGNLESISLIDVSQLLNVNRKTGMLKMTSGKSQGVLHFLNGEVIHAETPSDKGEMAAYQILEWTSGSFDFVAANVNVPTTIRRSVQDLVMDSARVSDSRKRLQGLFPDLTAVPWPKLAGDALLQGLKIYGEDRKVVPWLDGYRSFQDIMDATGLNDVAVLQAAATLKDNGRLEALQPELTLRVVTLKGGLFKKTDHLEVAAHHEHHWRAMGPYEGGIERLRLMWPQGPAVENVQFTAMEEAVIAIPKDLQSAWGLDEGSVVKVRPAP